MSQYYYSWALSVARHALWCAAEKINAYHETGKPELLEEAKLHSDNYRLARRTALNEATSDAFKDALLDELEGYDKLPSVNDLLIKHRIKHRTAATLLNTEV